MMFKDDYKNEIDKIKPSEDIKQKVLVSLDVKKEVKQTKPKLLLYRAATAIAACIALVLSLWAIGSDNIPMSSGQNKEPMISETTNNVTATSYSQIYKAVKSFIPEKPSAFDSIRDFGYDLLNGFSAKNSATDDVIIEEGAIEYEYSTTTDTETETETNPSSANGSIETNTNQSETSTAQSDSKKDYSDTTSQVDGVHEADIVKTDGEYIYSLSLYSGHLRIIKAGKEPKQLGSVYVKRKGLDLTEQMFLVDGKIIILANNYGDNGETSAIAIVYDVSKPEKVEELFRCEQSGYVKDSRMIGDKLYLITNYYVPVDRIDENKPATYIPEITCGNFDDVVTADCIYIDEYVKSPEYTVLCGYSMKDGSLCGTQSVLGGTYALYCSTNNIITAGYSKEDITSITRYSIDDGKIELKATGELKGNLLNQFSIDEYNGNFRFVTTLSRGIETRQNNYVSYKIENSNSLYVYNGELKQIGAIENLAPDERVYSVRFMGDIAYFVTFRQVDPLFSADLSDPQNPKIIGKLKIPGFSNYMFPYGKGLLFGIGQDADEKTGRTGGIKLSMFDINDPTNVEETAKAVLDVNYSDSLYNHKAIIADSGRNVIGFSVYANNGSEYRLFTFKDGEFKALAEIEINKASSNIRGLYIGQEFYVVSEDYLFVYDMNDYSLITSIYLTA